MSRGDKSSIFDTRHGKSSATSEGFSKKGLKGFFFEAIMLLDCYSTLILRIRFVCAVCRAINVSCRVIQESKVSGNAVNDVKVTTTKYLFSDLSSVVRLHS